MPSGYAILFLPGIGALVYLLSEILPGWLGSYEGRQARQRLIKAVNPTRRYPQLHDDLAIAADVVSFGPRRRLSADRVSRNA